MKIINIHNFQSPDYENFNFVQHVSIIIRIEENITYVLVLQTNKNLKTSKNRSITLYIRCVYVATYSILRKTDDAFHRLIDTYDKRYVSGTVLLKTYIYT